MCSMPLIVHPFDVHILRWLPVDLKGQGKQNPLILPLMYTTHGPPESRHCHLKASLQKHAKSQAGAVSCRFYLLLTPSRKTNQINQITSEKPKPLVFHIPKSSILGTHFRQGTSASRFWPAALAELFQPENHDQGPKKGTGQHVPNGHLSRIYCQQV